MDSDDKTPPSLADVVPIEAVGVPQEEGRIVEPPRGGAGLIVLHPVARWRLVSMCQAERSGLTRGGARPVVLDGSQEDRVAVRSNLGRCQALKAMKEAVEGHLAMMREQGLSAPAPSDAIDSIEVSLDP